MKLARLLAAAMLFFARVSVAQQPIPGFVRCDIPLVAVAPIAIAADDFNRDGNPDLALVDRTNGQVVVLLTDRGRFVVGDCLAATNGSNIPVSGAPIAIAAGDLDLDNAVDLAVGAQPGVIILRGNGKGGFVAEAPLFAGSNPQAVAVADVDGDGRPDIVVGNEDGVSILYGRTTGGFDRAVTLPVGGPVTFIAVEDLNKDSLVDVAAGSKLTGEVTVFLQRASRSFSDLAAFSVGVAPTALVPGDFDGDGTPDLAVTGGGSSGTVTVFLSALPGNETQPFRGLTPVITGPSPSALAVEDFNRDFDLDVVVTNEGDSTVPFFLGDGAGSLNRASGNCRGANGEPGECTTQAGPHALVLADVDGDGRSDVITVNQTAGSISVLLSSQPPPTPTMTPTATASTTPTASSTPTASPTPTPTPSATATPSATNTNTPRPTATFTITPTPTSQCFAGGVCTQGQSCAINTGTHLGRASGIWLLPAVVLWVVRRRRLRK